MRVLKRSVNFRPELIGTICDALRAMSKPADCSEPRNNADDFRKLRALGISRLREIERHANLARNIRWQRGAENKCPRTID